MGTTSFVRHGRSRDDRGEEDDLGAGHAGGRAGRKRSGEGAGPARGRRAHRHHAGGRPGQSALGQVRAREALPARHRAGERRRPRGVDRGRPEHALREHMGGRLEAGRRGAELPRGEHRRLDDSHAQCMGAGRSTLPALRPGRRARPPAARARPQRATAAHRRQDSGRREAGQGEAPARARRLRHRPLLSQREPRQHRHRHPPVDAGPEPGRTVGQDRRRDQVRVARGRAHRGLHDLRHAPGQRLPQRDHQRRLLRRGLAPRRAGVRRQDRRGLRAGRVGRSEPALPARLDQRDGLPLRRQDHRRRDDPGKGRGPAARRQGPGAQGRPAGRST